MKIEYLLVLLLAFYLDIGRSHNVEIEYFNPVSLSCENTDFNITSTSQILNKYWILPSGSLVDNTTKPPVSETEREWELFENFTLKIHSVNDEDFGFYYCIAVVQGGTIKILQQGLNIDGPYYGDLLDQYRHNAMVGGIAAGVLFVIISGSCAIWHYRYTNKRANRGRKEGLETTFDNAAMGDDEKQRSNYGIAESEKM